MFALPKDVAATATVKIAGQPVAAALARTGAEVRLALGPEAVVVEGSVIEIVLRWEA